MANFTTTSGTKTLVVGTEFSVAQNANFSSASPKTTTGYVWVRLDFSAVVAGDTVQVRVYHGIAGGTLTADDPATVVPGTLWRANVGLVGNSWDITVKQTAGTGRLIGFEVIQDTNDVNALTISNGAIAAATFAAGAITSTVLAANAITSSIIAASAIGASQIASSAITAAKFATDAIDGNALAAAAVTKIQSGLALAATALSTAQWTNAIAAALAAADFTRLDAAITSRAPASDTTTIIARLPAALVGGRISADVGSWLGTAAATPTVAGVPKVEDATTQARLTSIRAGLLDNLVSVDTPVSSRAPNTDTTTLLVRLSAIRAGLLDNLSLLDVASSTLATSTLVTGVASAVTAIGSAVTNVQSRLPAALIGGNIAAAVQTIADGAITAATTSGDLFSSVAGQVMASTVEAGITMAGAMRAMLSASVGKLAIVALTSTTKQYRFRNVGDTKDVVVASVELGGRTAVTVDPT